MKSRTLRLGVSIGISVLFLGLAVRNIEWGAAVAALRNANYLYVAPMIGVTVWTLYIRAQRWRVFLQTVRLPPMRTLVAATNIGFMANMVLPLRIGEVVRAVLVSRRGAVPLSAALASILLERVFDMFTVLLLFGLSALAVPYSAEVRQAGQLLTLTAVVVGSAIALIWWQERLALRIVRGICLRLPPRLGGPIEGFVKGFIKALEILQSPSAFARALAWSIYLWFVIASIYTLGLLGFHLQAPLVTASLVITTVVAIAVSVPSAPGYVGTFQFGCVLAMAIFGVAKSEAIAFSFVVHITQFVGTVGAGVYSLWMENMSFSDVESVQQQDDGAVA